MNQKREKNEIEPDAEAVGEATIREDCTEFQDDDTIEIDEPENREEELELKISELKDQLLRAVADGVPCPRVVFSACSSSCAKAVVTGESQLLLMFPP